MRLLIIGGTKFLGRHLAAMALEAGHEVALLHRGRTGAELFPAARHLLADRDDTAAMQAVLAGAGPWDAVIDTSAYVPRQVRTLAGMLAGRTRHYQLVSTISVYVDAPRDTTPEEAALRTLADETIEEVSGQTYGALKALCERAARQGFAGTGTAVLVGRPGLIVGPFDPTERFTWWVRRFARAAAGEPVLVPGDPAAPVQFIDARDLAAWMLAQATAGTPGTFNLTGPAQRLTMGACLEAMRGALGAGARLTWAPQAFLLQQGVTPWTELPLWVPDDDAGMMRIDIGRALRAGLALRPLPQTLLDTWAWARENPPAAPGATGIDPEREVALLRLADATPSP
ncbi:MAG: NAD-dependent epimerase/dehydratase family protein [Rubrivivax sp.]|nr:NAD-dependent epimerase/dehydratase family protein [Rubrivivax sp.]